jgi:hypothetical protein
VYGATRAASEAASVDRLVVVGTIDTNQTPELVRLQPLYIVPNAAETSAPVPGDYAIVLRGAGGTELARYSFTPTANDDGPAQPGTPASTGVLQIGEFVPYVAGTVRVDIVGPGSVLLKSVTSGANAPTVTVTSPNGGETASGATLNVTWTANDVDGDLLTFNIQYSADNGATWAAVAQNQTGTSASIDTSLLAASTQARIRVWASDGIHSASDTSNATFTVPNHTPTVTIIDPASASLSVVLDQTVALEALAYDADTGSVPAASITWSSNLAGALGTGPQLTISTLPQGTHTITVTVNDGQGGIATDSVQVVVGPNVEVTPAPVLFLPIVSRETTLP